MNTDVINLQNATAIGNIGQPGSGTALGKQEFLNLLMAQMGNQNPLDPMDNEGMIQQLTQFANLEQLQNMGNQFEDLLAITSAGNQAAAVSLLGKDVQVAGDEFKGPEAKLNYNLPSNAKDIQVEVREAGTNRVVRIIEDVPATEGRHSLEVKDLPEGDYRFLVVAKDAEGNELEAIKSVTENVTGVNFASNVPVVLTRSGREISAAELVEIFEPAKNAPAAANPSAAEPVASPEEPQASSDEEPIEDPA